MYLNNDCWHLVVSHFEHEARTLFKLLLISRQLFEVTVPILYSHPFNLYSVQPLYPRCRASDEKLRELINFCKDHFPPPLLQNNNHNNHQPFQQQQQPTIQWPITIHPITQPATVDYATLAWRVTYAKVWLEPATWFHPTKNCPLVTDLRIDTSELEKILPLAIYFCSLVILEPVPNNLHYRPSPTELDVEIVIKFVQAHKIAFPGLLQRVGSSMTWENFTFYTRLQSALSPVQSLYLDFQPTTNLTLLPDPSQHLQSLQLITDGGSGTLDPAGSLFEFLPRCRSLKFFKALSILNSKLFSWAVLEQQEQQQEPPSYQTRLWPKKLVQLEELDINGDIQILLDTLVGFQSSLKTIKFSITANMNERIDWPSSCVWMPNLVYLYIHYNPLNLDCLSTCCPNLQYLRIMPPFQETSAGKAWRVPKKLKTLMVKGAAVMWLEMESIKELKELETLELHGFQTGRQEEWVDLKGIEFPNLKKVILEEFPAHVIKGQFLESAKGLEEYSITFSKYVLDMMLSQFLSKPLYDNGGKLSLSHSPQDTRVKIDDRSLKKQKVDYGSKSKEVDNKQDDPTDSFLRKQRQEQQQQEQLLRLVHPCLRSLTIHKASVGHWNIKSFDNLLFIKDDDTNHNNSSNINNKIDSEIQEKAQEQQQQSPSSSSSSSPSPPPPPQNQLCRYFVYFPNLEHLSITFRDIPIGRLHSLVLDLIKVDSLLSLTLTGYLYDPKSVNKYNYSPSVPLYSRFDDFPEFELITETDRITRVPRMNKVCIIRLSLGDIDQYRYYWLPPPGERLRQAVTDSVQKARQAKADTSLKVTKRISKWFKKL